MEAEHDAELKNHIMHEKEEAKLILNAREKIKREE
jgi:hypothetical protein